MQDGLNIRFVTEKEFISLPGVDPRSTRIHARYIQDPNIVGGYTAEDTIIKSLDQGNIGVPSYTTIAQSCTGGFLRVRLGSTVHSHMTFHLWELSLIGTNSTKQTGNKLSEKMDSFFNNLNYLIRLAQEQNEKIHIDYVVAGSTERSKGERNDASDGPIEEFKQNSKNTREAIEQTLAQKNLEFKTKAQNNGVETVISASHFTGQEYSMNLQSECIRDASKIPMTHIYYDGKNSLIISPGYTLKNETTQVYPEYDVTPKLLAEHYGQIKLSENHVSAQAQEAIKHQQMQLGFTTLTKKQKEINKQQWGSEAAQALWDQRYHFPRFSYSMNGVSNSGQISSGIGNSSVYVTIYYGNETIGFMQDDSGKIRTLEEHEIAEKQQVGSGPENGYFFTQPRNSRSIEPSVTSDVELSANQILNNLADDLIDPNKSITIYTGAGISVAAGIDDIAGYNSRITGNRERAKTAADFGKAATRLKDKPGEVLNLVKEFYESFYFTNPTLAHEAIADLATTINKPLPVFTENHDLLHQKTGINTIIMKPADQMKQYLNEDMIRKLDCIVCTGLSHDDRGFIAYLRNINPNIKIIGNALAGQKPNFLIEGEQKDIYLPGNAHEIFPELLKLVKQKTLTSQTES